MLGDFAFNQNYCYQEGISLSSYFNLKIKRIRNHLYMVASKIYSTIRLQHQFFFKLSLSKVYQEIDNVCNDFFTKFYHIVHIKISPNMESEVLTIDVMTLINSYNSLICQFINAYRLTKRLYINKRSAQLFKNNKSVTMAYLVCHNKSSINRSVVVRPQSQCQKQN